MEKDEKEKQSVVVNSVVNIYGGNTQVQPSVTEANQIITIIGGTEQAVATQRAEEATDTPPTIPEAAIDLRKYVSKENMKDYLEEIERCSSASGLAKIVARMCAKEEDLTPDEVKKERFISIMRELAKDLTKGNTINNIRARIDDELKRRDMR